MPRPSPLVRPRTVTRRSVVLAMALGAGLVGVGVPALAQTTPDASDLAARLAELDAKTLALGEQIAAAQESLAARRAELAAAVASADDADDAAQRAEEAAVTQAAEVDALVAASYGGARTTRLSAVLVSDSPQDLLDRMTALDLLGEDSGERLAAATAARAEADRVAAEAGAARETAAAAEQRAVAVQQDVAARRAELETQSAQARTLLAELQAQVAAERAAAERAAAERAAAERAGSANRASRAPASRAPAPAPRAPASRAPASPAPASRAPAPAAAPATAAVAQLAASERAQTTRASRATAVRNSLFAQPTVGRFTSGYGPRGGRLHAGVDLANSIGTPIWSVSDGTVIDAGPANGYGQWVRVRHTDGTVSLYGHIDSYLVRTGDSVGAGQQIATMGNRGQSTGPHLHLEIHPGGADSSTVDPRRWLADRGVII